MLCVTRPYQGNFEDQKRLLSYAGADVAGGDRWVGRFVSPFFNVRCEEKMREKGRLGTTAGIFEFLKSYF